MAADVALLASPDGGTLVRVIAGEVAGWRSSDRANPSRWRHRARQESRSPNLDVLLLGGRPIREPVSWMGTFVMNTREEVVQAFADYKAGRLGSIPAVHGAPTAAIESRSQSTERPGA